MLNSCDAVIPLEVVKYIWIVAHRKYCASELFEICFYRVTVEGQVSGICNIIIEQILWSNALNRNYQYNKSASIFCYDLKNKSIFLLNIWICTWNLSWINEIPPSEIQLLDLNLCPIEDTSKISFDIACQLRVKANKLHDGDKGTSWPFYI